MNSMASDMVHVNSTASSTVKVEGYLFKRSHQKVYLFIKIVQEDAYVKKDFI